MRRVTLTVQLRNKRPMTKGLGSFRFPFCVGVSAGLVHNEGGSVMASTEAI